MELASQIAQSVQAPEQGMAQASGQLRTRFWAQFVKRAARMEPAIKPAISSAVFH